MNPRPPRGAAVAGLLHFVPAMKRRFICPVLMAVSTMGISYPSTAATRQSSNAIRRANVWKPTRVPAKNIRRGPEGPGSFSPGESVTCDYVDKALSGNSPKFACRMGRDELKVKFGGTNGEVYGEVAASRLLWALGFGADRMYPVRVICRGCPPSVTGTKMLDGTTVVDPAVIERKHDGVELTGDGWSWQELDEVSAAAGGAPRAHRDALKLLAVFLQHTDTKRQQQQLVCLGAGQADGTCARPFMFISDLGLTFGKANRTNANLTGSVNLRDWMRSPVWKDVPGCVGNLPKSLTGTLHDPEISEDGRRFLAKLLSQLTDRQLRELFESARVQLRPRSPSSGRSGFPEIQEWVDAFKQRRSQIVERRCAREQTAIQ